MANEKNLKPSEYKLTQEEAKKGGINSGKSRREKKAVQKILDDFLKKPASENSILLELGQKFGLSGEESIKELFTIICTIKTLENANLSDLERLTKLLGEQPEVTDSEEQKQIDAHNQLIEVLRERNDNK